MQYSNLFVSKIDVRGQVNLLRRLLLLLLLYILLVRGFWGGGGGAAAGGGGCGGWPFNPRRLAGQIGVL